MAAVLKTGIEHANAGAGAVEGVGNVSKQKGEIMKSRVKGLVEIYFNDKTKAASLFFDSDENCHSAEKIIEGENATTRRLGLKAAGISYAELVFLKKNLKPGAGKEEHAFTICPKVIDRVSLPIKDSADFFARVFNLLESIDPLKETTDYRLIKV